MSAAQTPYQKGAKGEWDIRKTLIDHGIQVFRSRGSKGRDLKIGEKMWASVRRSGKVPAWMYKFGDDPVEGSWWYMGPLSILWTDPDWRQVISHPPLYIKRELRTHEMFIGRRDYKDWRVFIRRKDYHEFKANNPVLDENNIEGGGLYAL